MDNIDKPTPDKPKLKVVSEEQDEAASSKAEHKPTAAQAGLGRRGVFLLPNLITTGSLFAGFYAIVTSMNGQPLTACTRSTRLGCSLCLHGLCGTAIGTLQC